MRILIVGWGYIGAALGERLHSQGVDVAGLRRGTTTAIDQPTRGIRLLQADITEPEQLRSIPPTYDCVVNCAAASGGGPEAYEAVYVRGNTNLIAWLKSAPPRLFIYTSSTGVYAQDNGETVDEQSPTAPETPAGRSLVKAEDVLLQAAHTKGFPAVILRLAGIYGPGRGYWLRQFLDGNAVLEGDGSRILNMIHRDDVVGAILAAMERGVAGDICNVVDDQPACQRDVFEWLAKRLGKPMPPSVPAETVARRRSATNKRVSNARLRQQYGCRLIYPTFREGFAAELARISPRTEVD